jgi:1-acyl-sn-glycerol-3-phosphate acyltransferase
MTSNQQSAHRGSLFTRLRSYFFFVPMVYLYTATFGIVALLWSLFERDGRVQHRIARAWATLILKTIGVHMHVEGLEHVAQQEAAVYAANHLSAVDIPVLYASLPGQFRIMAKKQLFRYPFLGWYLARSGQIPIVLGDAYVSLRSLKRAVEVLREGMPVAVFPEGGRSETGELQEFLGGAFYAAIRAQVPIIPMAIVGSYEILPMNSFHVIPGDVGLVIGEPIPTAGLTTRETAKLASEVRQVIADLYASHSEHATDAPAAEAKAAVNTQQGLQP